MEFWFAEIASIIIFGPHTFFNTEYSSSKRFWNYGHEEMRDDSPQHAWLRLTSVQYSVLYEYFFIQET